MGPTNSRASPLSTMHNAPVSPQLCPTAVLPVRSALPRKGA